MPAANADFKNYNRASSPPPLRVRKCEKCGLLAPGREYPYICTYSPPAALYGLYGGLYMVAVYGRYMESK